MYCSDFNLLQQKYAHPQTPEDKEIKRSLNVIAKLFNMCDESEFYYAEVITRHFCRIVHTIEKKKPAAGAQSAPNTPAFSSRYPSDHALMRDFYNHFKKTEQVDFDEIGTALESGRKELVNPTIKDYVARIYTFTTPKYLGKLFPSETLEGIDPVLFTYENIELILATFKTRDSQGEIIKQNVNIRSALRKLNEFKQSQAL